MTDSIVMTLLINTAVFSALFCIMLILRKTLAKRISPVLMLVLWFAVVMKLIVPFGFESRLSVLPQSAGTGIIQQYATPQLPKDNVSTAYTPAGNEPDAVIGTPSGTVQAAADTSSNADMQMAAGVDWKTIALAVWVAGALFTGAVLFLGAVNLRKRIKHSQADTPQHVLDIFEECRQMLGIRRDIRIITQSAFNKPMIMGVIRPVLVMPEDKDVNARKLKHIFLHELTHYKRADLWTIELMNILRALYWFNPLVWICFKLIRCDMELACDRKVINVLGEAHRLSYIETVLNFAGRKTQRFPAAAMGLSDGRPAMEQRIRGVFGRARTSLKGRVTAALLAVLILAAGALTACQPVIATIVPAVPYKTAEHWKETIKGDKLVIEIDTDVVQPVADKYPIVRVEPVKFSQPRVDELVNYFAKGRKLYKPHGFTKADYARWIAKLKEGEWVGGKKIVTENIKESIEQNEKDMAAAPESYHKEYISSALTYDSNSETAEIKASGKNFLDAMVENPDGTESSIRVNSYAEGYYESTSFHYNIEEWGGTPYITEWVYDHFLHEYEDDQYGDDWKNSHMDELYELYDKITLKKEDAQAAAEKAIRDLGIYDMTLFSACKAVSLEHPDKGGWQFEYELQSGGIPADAVGATPSGEVMENYMPFLPERLSILVTPDGIISFSWTDCSKIIETVSEQSELLPFDDIKRTFKDSMQKDLEYWVNRLDLKDDFSVMVNSARLCMCYTEDTNNPTRMLLVPVWAFDTKSDYQFETPLQEEQGIWGKTYIINAIDGTVLIGGTS